jgi:Flp pilus assembly protein TadG
MMFQSHNQFGNLVMALSKRLCDLRACSSGVVAVVTAMVLPLLLGFTSLGVEVGHWYLAQRVMQGAADAAAISAAAQYIADYNAGSVASLTYQTVGTNYASLNGFAIPTSNVCLVISSGDNCSTVRALDARAIVCAHNPCVVVEITQNTALWSTTKASLQPTGQIGKVQAIPTPTLLARAIVSANSTTTTTNGGDCILALANSTSAVLVHGNGDLTAKCGVSVDGGRDQNVGTPVGGITFNGAHAKINISALTISGPPSSTVCPDGGVHCQTYGSTAALPASAVFTNTATADPYAATLNFPTPPSGVKTGGVAIKTAGSGYTNGTCTFTVTGGTPYVSGTPSPVIFKATISGGQVTAIQSITDPGAYTASGFPTNPVTATDTCGGSTAATFNLTEGCFTWAGTPIAGRKYCSIGLSSYTNLSWPAGSYYIAGGDGNCGGFCASGNVNVTSAPAGVTFFLTNGEGAGTYGVNSFATVTINGNASLALCAPGTVAAGKVCDGTSTQCTGTCMLFVQNPAATAPATTINAFNGTANSVLSGLIYLPKETFQASGNGTVGGCFGVIADFIDVGGTPTFANGCLPGHGIGGTTNTSLSTPYLYQ